MHHEAEISVEADKLPLGAALIRMSRSSPGRYAKHEFGKLSIEKAQHLSDHFGFKNSITKPMTIAEIVNPNEKEYGLEKIRVMGFRREEVMMN